MFWRNVIIAPTGIYVWDWILEILIVRTGGREAFRLLEPERRNVNSAMKMIVKANALATGATKNK